MLVAIVDDDRLQAEELVRLVRRSPALGRSLTRSSGRAPVGAAPTGRPDASPEADGAGGGPAALGDVDVRCFDSLDGFERFCRGGEPAADIVFMDIRFGGPDGAEGIEAVARLFPRGSATQVVYVTGYGECHSKVYSTQHAGFLIKPAGQEAVDEALAEALRRRAESSERPVLITSGGDVRVVLPRDVMWVESHRRLLCIHTRHGEVKTYLKLARIAEMLPDRFVHCHQSFLVNLDYVTSWGGDRFVLTDGRTIPISQRRRAATRAAVLAYARTVR
ncbi:LytR/AlgR family response regulator transcription factor [Bifidobacterium phasiani]|uniref:Response regulator transcription factor n=1 Tax=Bifidobacterium phasiani TaxID=2834431 RepID=A0ABS6W6H2_9BIFI|nr:LytTR family DNA-binding domain-containing protein [Bifidobacterium phasiani]MBW3082086.1 response regulator transcription factor [Bifidobacterium phasiani]